MSNSAAALGNLDCNKIASTIADISKMSKERSISPEKRQKIIDDLRLI